MEIGISIDFFSGIFMEDWLKNHLRTSQFAVENQHV